MVRAEQTARRACDELHSVSIYKVRSYLLVMDYYSRYVDIAKLDTVASSDVSNHRSRYSRGMASRKQIFSSSENGPRYAAQEFGKFAEFQGFTHITNSPRYLQSNGKAERAMQTVKKLLKKSADPYKAWLSYRATHLECGYPLSQLLIGEVPSFLRCHQHSNFDGIESNQLQLNKRTLSENRRNV